MCNLMNFKHRVLRVPVSQTQFMLFTTHVTMLQPGDTIGGFWFVAESPFHPLPRFGHCSEVISGVTRKPTCCRDDFVREQRGLRGLSNLRIFTRSGENIGGNGISLETPLIACFQKKQSNWCVGSQKWIPSTRPRVWSCESQFFYAMDRRLPSP